MPRCSAVKPNGEHCERIVGASQEYCYAHDPNRQEERRRNAARAGRGGPSREIRELKDKLASLYADVLAGDVDRGDATVCNQIINTRLRALALERVMNLLRNGLLMRKTGNRQEIELTE